ncbi:hypothetical protein RSOL_247460, partial [Rhizoctonia solani AG-3 Rhs1AP]
MPSTPSPPPAASPMKRPRPLPPGEGPLPLSPHSGEPIAQASSNWLNVCSILKTMVPHYVGLLSYKELDLTTEKITNELQLIKEVLSDACDTIIAALDSIEAPPSDGDEPPLTPPSLPAKVKPCAQTLYTVKAAYDKAQKPHSSSCHSATPPRPAGTRPPGP